MSDPKEHKSSLLFSCCQPCIQCCCPDDKDRYPHVQYKTPAQANVAVGSPQFSKVPFQKVFKFHQPRTEYGVHPQITSSSDTESTEVISDQPQRLQRPASLEYGRRGVERSRSVSPSPQLSDTLPTLQYSVYFDMQRSTLTVDLERAYNLPSRFPEGKCDSFVVLYLLPNKNEIFETQVARGSLNPVFNQVFVFSGQLFNMDIIRKQSLIFKVFEQGHRFTSRELVGVVTVPLETADIYGVSVKSRIVEKEIDSAQLESLGEVLLSLSYRTQTSTLHGILLKATSLRRQHLAGYANPYIKINVYHKNKKVHKWKSQVKKHTLGPVFNEPFHFDIFQMDVEDISLHLVIMDYDRFSRDQVVGEIHIGLKATDEASRTHWEEMIASPGQAVSRWLTITPVSSEHLVVSPPMPRSHTL